jgi:putative FmdB family regulatory protein
MPLYEYSCLECGIDFESLVLKSSEIAELKCPSCGGNKLEQKVSSFASISDTGAANCAPTGG